MATRSHESDGRDFLDATATRHKLHVPRGVTERTRHRFSASDLRPMLFSERSPAAAGKHISEHRGERHGRPARLAVLLAKRDVERFAVA